ncbi:MAG: hypothetical protein HY535_08615 [Chloroflexi bacterium]|nr:hypothetical protein [Chloroflexota bacterium]
MLVRLLRALRLDGGVYQEVKDDPQATFQALSVLLMGSLSLTLAGLVRLVPLRSPAGGLQLFAWSLASALAGWVAMGLLAYGVGRGLRRPASLLSLLRTLGFAQAPGLLYGLLAVPGVEVWVNAGVLLWMLLGMAVGLRQALVVSRVPAFFMAAAGLLVAVGVRDLLRGAVLGGA